MKITTVPKIYMAGPDVFFENAPQIIKLKREIASKYGIEPLFPLDNVIKDIFARKNLSSEEKGLIISRANEKLIDAADGTIANITPWHGPSLDVGTSFEIGYTRAQNKPIVCYTNSPQNFSTRVRNWLAEKNIKTKINEFGLERDEKFGNLIEDFGDVSDNIMIDGACILSGTHIERPMEGFFDKSERNIPDFLMQFTKAVIQMSENFKNGTFAKKASQINEFLRPYLNELPK